MTGFEFQELELRGAYLIHNFFAGDNRGGFTKCFEKNIFLNAGISFQLNETFVSRSMKNVIRGLHFQTRNPQAKLVSVLSGRVWDVIVDIRVGSPTYKNWIAHELSAENHLGFFIPRGFAHGFASLEDNTVMLYQCDGKYDSETDTGILFNDSTIGIEWPVGEKIAILSQRDLGLMSFKEYEKKIAKC
ncbi:MAG: dTDP-4-dehydrorhamnose 3,5-epimerase [Lachnospiraceae bacterium]|nr:dTDP-4-dehydrorhamnose 3,5-epimerase [Lachnospiraceae bacterium]